MTRTAKRLYISQQTLSNQITRLEKQLGCQLFYRKPTLSLTVAGEKVLAFANEILSEEADLRNILNDIENEEKGLIRFGAPAMRANLCVPAVMPAFYEKYPNVELRLINGVSRELVPMILDGSLDLAVIVTDDIISNLVYTPMMEDQIFLCLPDVLFSNFSPDLRLKLHSSLSSGVDMRDFQDVPFYIFDNHLGDTIQRCFDISGVKPHVLLTSPSTRVVTKLGLNGKAAFFSTQMILSDYIDQIPENLHIFPVACHQELLFQKVYLVRHRQRYLSRYTSFFMDLLTKYFRNVAHFNPGEKYDGSVPSDG